MLENAAQCARGHLFFINSFEATLWTNALLPIARSSKETRNNLTRIVGSL